MIAINCYSTFIDNYDKARAIDLISGLVSSLLTLRCGGVIRVDMAISPTKSCGSIEHRMSRYCTGQILARLTTSSNSYSGEISCVASNGCKSSDKSLMSIVVFFMLSPLT